MNEREDVDAILVQLPLPHGFNPDVVVAEIASWKDVDGFHPEHLRQFQSGGMPPVLPPVALAVMRLIEAARAHLIGASVVLVVKSDIFALPLRRVFEERGAQVTVVPSTRGDFGTHEVRLRNADIVVSAVGQPGIIHADMLKTGVVLIDIGTSRVTETIDGVLRSHVVGDVDRVSTASLSGYVSPVPGGIGPLTVAYVLANTLELARKNRIRR